MSSGVGVTAKVTWIPIAGEASSGRGSVSSRGGYGDRHNANANQDVEGRNRWIHCTPLIGSDEKVGVWMVVMVESENITGSIHTQQQQQQQQNLPDRSGPINSPVYASSSNKLYSQYLRREDRQDSMIATAQHQFPRPGTSQTLKNNTRQGDLSKQGSTRSRGTAADLAPQSPTSGHFSTQAAAGARRGSTQRGIAQQPEIRAGPYQGAAAGTGTYLNHPSVRKPTGHTMSGMGSGNLTGAAAASYGPPPPPPPKEPTSVPYGSVHAIGSPPRPGDRQTHIGGVDREMGREREVYERNKAEKEQREGRGRERAEVDEDTFRNFSS